MRTIRVIVGFVYVTVVMYHFRMSNAVQWDKPIQLSEDAVLWSKQEEESDDHYSAFQLYLKLPLRCDPSSKELRPRHLDDMLEQGLVKWSRRHLVKVARRFSWELRARAHDDDVDAGLAGKIHQHRLMILENRLSIISSGQEALKKVMQSMAERSDEWRPRDAAVLLEVLSRLEDGLLGMTQYGGPVQASAMAGAQAVVVNQGGPVLEEHMVEVARELQHRLGIGGAAVVEGEQVRVEGDVE